MLRKSVQRRNKGQSLMEYTIVLGIIVAVMVAMGPLIQSGSQGMIKIVADQIGNQQAADQLFGDSGYLEESMTNTLVDMQTTQTQTLSNVYYLYDDVTQTMTNSTSDLGFSEIN